MTQAPLSYHPGIETPEADEQATIDGIIEGMTDQSRTVQEREGHAVRASHAKSTALVTGTLEIAPDLPPELAQGLFAAPGTLPVAVRFAQGPGERLGDRVSTHRGMSVKVFGATGEKLAGHAGDTQDFVLASGATFPSSTAKGFLRDGTVIGKSTGLPEGVKSAVSLAARNFNRVLNAVGANSPKADFFGHPFSHPLSEPYYSQAPLRFGAHVAKIAAFPVGAAQEALSDWRLDPHEDEDGFRHATVAHFARHDVTFEIRVQLWTDADTQPIEDASVEWSEEESPYRTVAVLQLPRQDAYSPARQDFFHERMTFRPAHALRDHQPLGSVMRARLQVYAALSDFRHEENGIVAVNPVKIEEVPV
ncbi:catalase family protein [Falsirhodobacter sp. 1013]|uniref:catalase family protein n=1 Tax=Falsirhodobacter sp. 1013 TaxID=3417566 RepID=UPI003EB83E0E